MTQDANAAFAAHVTTLAASLNQLDYYALLNVARGSSADDIKRAYHKVAAIYHPDGHRYAAPQVKTCLMSVFKRMSEAYRTLSDHRRRMQYDAQLQQGQVRMAQQKREQTGPRSPDASLKTPAGKRCFLNAVNQIKRKDYKGAKLNLQLALTHEGGASQVVKDKQAELDKLMKSGK